MLSVSDHCFYIAAGLTLSASPVRKFLWVHIGWRTGDLRVNSDVSPFREVPRITNLCKL